MDPVDGLHSFQCRVTGSRFVTIRFTFKDGTRRSVMLVGDDAEEFTDTFRDRIEARRREMQR